MNRRSPLRLIDLTLSVSVTWYRFIAASIEINSYRVEVTRPALARANLEARIIAPDLTDRVLRIIGHDCVQLRLRLLARCVGVAALRRVDQRAHAVLADIGHDEPGDGVLGSDHCVAHDFILKVDMGCQPNNVNR